MTNREPKGDKALGRRLLAWREAMDLTQPQLARKCGWPGKGTKISPWETGERYPGIHDMLHMAKCCPITIEYIYQDRAGEMGTRIMEKIERGADGFNAPFPAENNG